ncbi:MAG: DUF1223 domain-containing protein [Proteobacteria bacterium]|nr:MAG: DUF1223 domain-containing protein [Pseudomonadota bacterium]QKK10728.1 MAG: DUF1223 domain-containing protein [Pseudomonadota bacterium]
MRTNTQRFRHGAVALALSMTLGSALAETELRIESPTRQAQLIELYTSEGCSSCPPADRWLSGLKDEPRLWQQIVPVAFHVDYWNYIGWPDRFSSSAYSDRQRRYAASGGVSTVYTPGFVVNGEEWRGWFRGRMLTNNAEVSAGKLSATGSADALQVRFEPANGNSVPLQLHVARLGFDLHTDVGAGENSGRKLSHDFVVLGHVEHALKREGATHTALVKLPPARESAPRQGVALWVTRKGELRPLQAAGGWLTP